MRGFLILRLVDIMLLLLLSMMAAASITPMDAPMPITHELVDQGRLPGPLNIAVTPDGTLHLESRVLTLPELKDLIHPGGGHLVLYASAEAPASSLIEVARIARAAQWRTAFVVERRDRADP